MRASGHDVSSYDESAAPVQAPGAVFDRESRLCDLRAGDDEAYELLVRTEAPRLLSVARRLLRHEEDARDAVQEAFLLAFRSLPKFQERSSVSTWLYRIVVNVALMKLRARERKPETSIEDLLPVFRLDGQHASDPDEWRMPALDRLLREEVRSQVRAAIDVLPESYRLVLLLRDIEELSTDEVAAHMGITTNAVKIRLHRGRQALRTLLDPLFRRSRGFAIESVPPHGLLSISECGTTHPGAH